MSHEQATSVNLSGTGDLSMPSPLDEVSLEELHAQYAELLCLRECVEWLENRRVGLNQKNWMRKVSSDVTQSRKRRGNAQSEAPIRLQ